MCVRTCTQQLPRHATTPSACAFVWPRARNNDHDTQQRRPEAHVHARVCVCPCACNYYYYNDNLKHVCLCLRARFAGPLPVREAQHGCDPRRCRHLPSKHRKRRQLVAARVPVPAMRTCCMLCARRTHFCCVLCANWVPCADPTLACAPLRLPCHCTALAHLRTCPHLLLPTHPHATFDLSSCSWSP